MPSMLQLYCMKITDEQRYILLMLQRRGPLARKDIAESCRMSIPKATGLLAELKDARIIEPLTGVSSGGRIPELLHLRKDLFYTVGIDVGTEYIRVALFDIRGKMLASSAWHDNIEFPRDLPLNILEGAVRRVCTEAHVPLSNVKSLGIAITGILHEKEGRCLFLRNTPLWKGLDVVKGAQAVIGVSSVIIRDSVRSMAVAEERFGSARGLKDFVVFNVGIGLGAGIVLNGSLLSGDRGTSGEFGHMHIRPSGELCVCGNYGCLEATASAWAILKRCKEAIATGVETSIGAGKGLSEISVADIIEAADDGDKVAVKILEDMADDLALGIGSIMNILNPEKIILSGGTIRAAKTHMLGPITRGIKAIVIPWLQKNISIEVSQLGEWDAALGVFSEASESYIAQLEELPTNA